MRAMFHLLTRVRTAPHSGTATWITCVCTDHALAQRCTCVPYLAGVTSPPRRHTACLRLSFACAHPHPVRHIRIPCGTSTSRAPHPHPVRQATDAGVHECSSDASPISASFLGLCVRRAASHASPRHLGPVPGRPRRPRRRRGAAVAGHSGLFRYGASLMLRVWAVYCTFQNVCMPCAPRNVGVSACYSPFVLLIGDASRWSK